MKKLLAFELLFVPLIAMAQNDSLKVDTTMSLSGVTVTGARIYNKVDRQVFMPTKAIVRSSTDGYDLLKRMSLAGIRVSTADQKITSLRGGTVQVRINDVKADAQDVLALRPDEVVRVEYIDNPGVRYSEGNIDAVVNYIVRRCYSGYVGGMKTMQALWEWFNNTSAYFKYNHKKSEFSVNYRFNHRWYDQQRNVTTSSYIQPDGTVRNRDYIGFNNKMTYSDNNLQLGYNLAEPEKYMLNVRFNFGWNNQPYSGPIHRVVETGKADLLTYNRRSVFDKVPSLDVYYSINLPHKQTLALNAVGTYIGTDYAYHQKEYLYAGSLDETLKTNPQNDYSYDTDGKKYSFIGEGVYTKNFAKTAFSAGANYAVSRTDNAYTGAVNENTVLNSNNLYAFVQLQGSLGKLNYQAGVGANYTSIHQGEAGFNRWTFRPQLTLSTNAIKNVSLKYTGRIQPNLPSLSQLSDVRQQRNDMDISDGNTSLVPYTSYSNRITAMWSRKLFDLQTVLQWWYAPDIIMTSIIPEKQQDGSWLYSSKPMNQKYFSQLDWRAHLTVHAIKDKLDVTAYGVYLYQNSKGLDYQRKFGAWRYGFYANLMLGPWAADYYFETAQRYLDAESVYGGENSSNLEVSYKYKNIKVGLGCVLLGYAKGYDYTAETHSRYFVSNTHQTIKNNGNMAYITVSWNFSHGRTYKTAERSMNNSDRDNGIR